MKKSWTGRGEPLTPRGPVEDSSVVSQPVPGCLLQPGQGAVPVERFLRFAGGGSGTSLSRYFGESLEPGETRARQMNQAHGSAENSTEPRRSFQRVNGNFGWGRSFLPSAFPLRRRVLQRARHFALSAASSGLVERSAVRSVRPAPSHARQSASLIGNAAVAAARQQAKRAAIRN